MSKPWEFDCRREEANASFDAANDKEAQYETKPRPSEKSPLLRRRRCNCDLLGCCTWLQDLRQTFGYRLLLLLFTIQHLLKGFVFTFSQRAVPYLYEAYGVPAPQAQVFNGVVQLPWAMKPIVGLLSDILPIFGYNKAPYMVITSVLGIAALCCLGASSTLGLPITVAVLCLFFRTMQTTTCDLLTEAKYSEQIKLHPVHGPDLLAFVWFGMQFWDLIAVAASGVAIWFLGWRLMLGICAIPAAALLLPLLSGYMQECRVTAEEKAATRRRFYEQQEMCWLCLMMFASTVLLAVTGIVVNNRLANALIALAVAVVVLTCFSVTLSPVIAKFNAFAFIQSACMISTSAAAFRFFTDTPEQYPATATSPGGPHFSAFFYNSVVGTVGSACSLIGIWTYKRYMSTWKYRSLLVFTNLVYSVLSALDLLVYSRKNIQYGIPDTVFVLSSAAMESVIGQWMWMPQVVVLSYMCPKGMEATMFALLAGCHNLGGTIAANVGALVLEQLNVHPSGAVAETETFDNLWVAAMIGMSLPLFCICTLYWLIPDAYQTERFTNDTDDSATSGSLWRHWMRGDA